MAVLNLQWNHMEDEDNFFVFLFPFLDVRDLKIRVLSLSKLRCK